MNLSTIAGVVLGIIIGLIILVIIKNMLITDKTYRTKYDERQKIVRGKGYKYSFWMLSILITIYAMVDSKDISIPVQRSAILIFIILICGLFHIIYCIFNDGYFGINTSPKAYYIVIVILGIFEVVVGIMSRDMLIEDGKLTNSALLFFFGFMFFAIGVSILIKNIISKDKGDDEDEEDDE
ncbi:MAG: hypothetical protein IKS48_01100 [Eubacterium sp.]|nr:hypothetical protein [Eubacterium sp.]